MAAAKQKVPASVPFVITGIFFAVSAWLLAVDVRLPVTPGKLYLNRNSISSSMDCLVVVADFLRGFSLPFSSNSP